MSFSFIWISYHSTIIRCFVSSFLRFFVSMFPEFEVSDFQSSTMLISNMFSFRKFKLPCFKRSKPVFQGSIFQNFRTPSFCFTDSNITNFIFKFSNFKRLKTYAFEKVSWFSLKFGSHLYIQIHKYGFLPVPKIHKS